MKWVGSLPLQLISTCKSFARERNAFNPKQSYRCHFPLQKKMLCKLPAGESLPGKKDLSSRTIYLLCLLLDT